MIHKLYLTEVLQREVEIEAESVEEALEILNDKYDNSEIYLDYSDLILTEMADTDMREKDVAILQQIERICENCSKVKECIEDKCYIFRIIGIINDGFFIEEASR